MNASNDDNPGKHLLVCVLGRGDPAWLALLEAQLQADARVRQLDAADAGTALAQLAPTGRDVVLVAADAWLPRHWAARLVRALALDDVLAVAPLVPEQLPGVAPPGAPPQLEHLDALCHVHGLRGGAGAARLGGPLIAVRAAALPLVARGIDVLDADALPAPWRLLQLGDMLAAGASLAAHGAPAPVLAAAVQAAQAAGVPDPGLPGVDARAVVLHVLHGWGGGAARWVRDLAAADPERHHLLLRAHGDFRTHCHGQSFSLADARQDEAGPAWRRWHPARGIADTALHHAGWAALLAGIVADYGVGAVVVSSLIGHALDALRSGLPTRLVVHDHYPLWPVLHCNFGAAGRRFDAGELEAGLAAAGADFEFAHRDAAYWQRLRDAWVAAALEASATLVAPSHSALAAQLRLAPELRELEQRVIPHGLAPWPAPVALPAPPPRARLRLVIPGRIRGGKGAALLRALLPGISEHAELVLLGAGAAGMDFFGVRGVHVVLDYARDALPRLLAQLAPDAALLLPTVSETFSYTLSEMRSLGLPVIATDIGALGERIDDGVDGLLVPPLPDAQMYVAALASERTPLERVRAHLRAAPEPVGLEAMQVAWAPLLDVARRPIRPAVATPPDEELDAAQAGALALRADLRRRAQELRALRTALEERSAWAWRMDRERRASSARVLALQDELESEQARATAALDQLHRELGERTAWAQAIDARLQSVLASRSWRLTRPLRGCTQFARRVRESLRFRLARLRSLRGRLRGSLQRRGWRGTARRIRQEFNTEPPRQLLFQAPQPDAAFEPFALPTSAAPEVSIIIPVYNKLEYTLACLRSLTEHAGSLGFEVIVVDDASTDATAGRLAEIDGVWVLRNTENLGFVGSCNAGAELARGAWLVFLNNDTLVTAGWLEALHACFDARPDAGLVGARLLYPDGRLQEAGGIVFRDGSGWNYGRREHPDDPRFSFRREADYCSGAAIMLRRELFTQLGGFDARYAPAYYEDTDLAFKVRRAGLKVYVEPRALVAHFEGVSNGTDEDAGTGLKRYQKLNREKFRAAWREELAAQPQPLIDPARAHLAATWRARKRVLIVDATTPEPDQDSGSVRMRNIMRLLRDMGCQVSFLPDNLARFEKYTALLQAEGVEALYHPFVESLPAFYRARGGEFDLIIVSRHYVLAHHLGLIRVHAPQARLAFDTVDLHYLREARAAELDPRPELKRQAEATRQQEQRLIRESDVTLVVSKVEQALLAREVPEARVEILSNVHEIRGTTRGWDARRDLLFVGGFQHAPNIDAMLWFVGAVLPLVRAELPQVALDIVGSKMVPEVEALAGEGVRVHGWVEDLEPLLEGARMALAPLRYGAGVKGKVNMAMSRGLPVVATPMAIEGIDVEPGHDVLVGADAAAFAAAVVRLYRDPELWQELSANAVNNVRRQFSFAVARETLETLLRD